MEKDKDTEERGGFQFIGHLKDAEAMKAIADELRRIPDQSAIIAGARKAVGELVQDLEEGNEAGIRFLGLRRRAEEQIRSIQRSRVIKG